MGDRIRWSDVLPDVDLEVRYIHDILKVDVIVKQTRREAIQSRHAQGWLTARFDIPSALVRSQVKQAGVSRDLYAEALDIDQPLTFEQDGKTVHKMRPVENYILDPEGKPLRLAADSGRESFSGRQTWRLRQGAAGEAELSADLAVLRNAPQGDLVVDPSVDFVHNVDGYTGCEDSFLYINENNTPNRSTYNYGGASELSMWAINPTPGYQSETRPIIRFNDIDEALKGRMITSASLKLTLNSRTGSTPPATFRARPFIISSTSGNWVEGNGNHWEYPTANWVTWSHKQYDDIAWSNAGVGTSDRSGVAGPPVDIRNLDTSGETIDFPITPILPRLWSYDASQSQSTDGILLEIIDKQTSYYDPIQYYFHSSEATTAANRPKLVVNWGFAQLGAMVGGINNVTPGTYTSDRVSNFSTDKLELIRYFVRPSCYVTDQTQQNTAVDFFEVCEDYGKKVVFQFTVGINPKIDTCSYFSDADDCADFVKGFINALDTNNLLDSLYAIEFGGEEDDANLLKWATNPVHGGASRLGGQQFADYYIKTWDAIKDNSAKPEWAEIPFISGGSIYDYKQLIRYGSPPHGAPYDFIQGFLDVVTQGQNFGKAPEVFSIHTYAQEAPPEGFEINAASGGAFPNMLQGFEQVYELCKDRGYFPNLATTEYGFGASRPSSPFFSRNVPSNGRADNISQATYYLRSVLLSNFIRPEDGDACVGMEANLYWAHPRMNWDVIIAGDDAVEDWGFHNYDSWEGSSKAVRDVSRIINNPTYNITLNDSKNKVWVPLEIKDYSSATDDYREYAYCGLDRDYDGDSTPEEDLWLIAWATERKDTISGSGVAYDYYEPSSGLSIQIQVPGDYMTGYSQSVKKFTYTQSSVQSATVDHLIKDAQGNLISIDQVQLPYYTGNATFSNDSTTVLRSHSGGVTTFTVTVDENPLFIRLTK